MKSKLLVLVVLISMLVALAGPANVEAAAYGLTFTTSVTYQNVTDTDTSVNFVFYPGGEGTGIPIARPDLPGMAASSLYVGSLGDIDPGFQGSAILMTTQQVAATLVQLPPGGSTVKVRPLSNGFVEGSDYVLVPTILKATFNKHSLWSVQNVDDVAADLVVTFKPVGGTAFDVNVLDLPAGAARFFDMATAPEITTPTFNGSVTIQAYEAGTTDPGSVVATSVELGITNDEAYAFEGFTSGSNTVYMPSAFCNWGPTDKVRSAFAVQNTEPDGGADAEVTVTYSNGNIDVPVTIHPGEKASFSGCGQSGSLNPTDFLGSAIITSVGGKIVAMGKVGGDGGYSTAYSGFSQGYSEVAMPYVRWSQTQYFTGVRQQVNIAIQNVGSAIIPAGEITISYYDINGDLVGTDTNPSDIAIGGKYSSNANKIPGGVGAEFGYAVPGVIGGGAIVSAAGAELAVMGRVCTYNTARAVAACEDYNGSPVTP